MGSEYFGRGIAVPSLPGTPTPLCPDPNFSNSYRELGVYSDALVKMTDNVIGHAPVVVRQCLVRANGVHPPKGPNGTVKVCIL